MGIETTAAWTIGIVWFIIVAGVIHYTAKYLDKHNDSDEFIRNKDGLIDDLYL